MSIVNGTKVTGANFAFKNGVSTNVAVGTSSTLVVNLNGKRGLISLGNNSDNDIFLHLTGGTAELNKGHYVASKSTHVFTVGTQVFSSINAICGVAAQNLCIMEMDSGEA